MQILTFLSLFLLFASPAWAAPAVTNVTGALTHGGNITITGTGFGSKSPVAPFLWDATDAASTDDLATHWPTDTFPKTCASPGETPWDMAYRSSFHGFSTMPHSRVTKFLCSAATTCSGVWDSNWAANLVTSDTDFDSDILWGTYYYRISNTFAGATTSPNLKEISANGGDGTYLCGELPDAYVDWCNTECPHMTYPASAKMRGDGGTGCSTGYVMVPNPMVAWVHVEIDWTTGGYIFGYSNGSATGQGERASPRPINGCGDGPPDAISIGGFTRWPMLSTTGNYRYWAAIYLDRTYSRVMLGNAATWATSTKREPQIPSAWATGSITATVNLGSLVGADAKYLYVFDSANTPSAGYFLSDAGGPTGSCTLSTSGTGSATLGAAGTGSMTLQ